jgi:hypothetical protein
VRANQWSDSGERDRPSTADDTPADAPKYSKKVPERDTPPGTLR